MTARKKLLVSADMILRGKKTPYSWICPPIERIWMKSGISVIQQRKTRSDLYFKTSESAPNVRLVVEYFESCTWSEFCGCFSLLRNLSCLDEVVIIFPDCELIVLYVMQLLILYGSFSFTGKRQREITVVSSLGYL